MACKGPLSGYRVLDMTQFESGTVCTETLAWLGAEVLKVERPVKGELGRYSQANPGVDTYGFLVMNMNKKSITCNAKSPEGLQLLKDLVAKSDVIVENMGPGSMNNLGLSRSQWEPYYNNGKVPNRRVGNGMALEDVAPSDTYPCKPFDKNDYVHIYCSRHPGSKQWDNLCDVIERPDLKQDVCPEMATPRSRYEHRDICDGAIKDWLKDYDKFTAMDILCKADIPAGALLSVDDITNDPQYYERGMMVEINHPQRGKVKLPGFAPKMSEVKVEYECSPELGGSNEEVYGGLLGLSEEKLAELKAKKVI